MSEPTQVAAPERARPTGLCGQRRSFLVHKRSQLRASLLTASTVALLLVFVNLVLYAASARARAGLLVDAPELEPLLRGQDQVELGLVLVASLVFLAGVFVFTILETHRTAGAAYNLERRLDALSAGSYGTRLKLRRGDNLGELERAFNDLATTLSEREAAEVALLDALAAQAPTDPSGAGSRLTALAAEKRARLR